MTRELSIYAEKCIPEYWIIDPGRQVVLVLSLKNNQYDEARFTSNQLIGSPTLPNLNLTVEQILQTR